MVSFDVHTDDPALTLEGGLLPSAPTAVDGASTVLATTSSAAPVSANVSAPRPDSITVTATQEDTASDPTGNSTNSPESRTASLDRRLMCCKELFESLPKAFYNPIKTNILSACRRIELIVRKMDAIHKLTVVGYLPKGLLVKLNLTCNKDLKNNPETCQRQKAWEETKKTFQKNMTTILAAQVKQDTKMLIQTHIELIIKDLLLFATQYTLYTRKRKQNEYRDCDETDNRYAIGAVIHLIYYLPPNSAFFNDIGFEYGRRSQWLKYHQDANVVTDEDKAFYLERAVCPRSTPSDQWNDGANDLLIKERQLIQEVGKWLEVIPEMHTKTYNGIETWKWEQEATIALNDNMKKVAGIDLVEHIERNIGQDQKKTLEDALYKFQENKEKKGEKEQKKAARNLNKKNKNKRKQDLEATNKQKTDQVSSNKSDKKRNRRGNLKNDRGPANHYAAAATAATAATAAAAAPGPGQTFPQRSQQQQQGQQQNFAKRQQIVSMQQGNQAMVQMGNPFYTPQQTNVSYGIPPHNLPLPPPPRYQQAPNIYQQPFQAGATEEGAADEAAEEETETITADTATTE